MQGVPLGAAHAEGERKMSGYVIACYAVTVGSLVAYSAWVVRRYLAVSRRAARDERGL
ncbi:MAG: hypothetical protein QOJ00_2572 [Actinomycetota bacterium]